MQKSRMPVLNSFLRAGAGTWKARTVYPSITLVSHVSMLTGIGPAKHKVDWNDWKPRKGLVPVPTIFSLAKRRGFTTALFAGKEKFRHLNQPGTLDRFAIPDFHARKVASVAADYIIAHKPHVCFIHFADSDGAGHLHGWGSRQQRDSFADEDDALGIVWKAIQKAGIAQESVLILSADHGGHGNGHGTNSPDDMIIPWITFGASVKRGYTITAPVTTYDTAATALWLLGIPIPSTWDGKPVTTAFL